LLENLPDSKRLEEMAIFGKGCRCGLGDLLRGLTRAAWRKPGGDHCPAELDEHVLEGRLGLGPVPGLGGAAVIDVGRVARW
jgi:hypothetical protein